MFMQQRSPLLWLNGVFLALGVLCSFCVKHRFPSANSITLSGEVY